MRQWENQLVKLLPSSWERLADVNLANFERIRSMLDHQFESPHDFDQEPTAVEGETNDVLVGIYEQYCLARNAVIELIHDDDEEDATEANAELAQLTDMDRRIVRVIDVAHEIMVMGYTALTGIAVHKAATQWGTAMAEPPAWDNTAIPFIAVRTMAYAGALARAAAKMIEFRIWPMDN